MLGHRIRLLRCQKGLSQAELGHKLNVSASTIGLYEQCRREPSLDTVVLLAQEFEVTINFLLTGQCICPQDINCRSQVLRYIQEDIQDTLRALFPDLGSQKEMMAIVATILLEGIAV